MILKNNLYKITYSNIEEKTFHLELLPDCVIYKAHFPEQPITPGVCIIQIASELLRDLIHSDLELIFVSNAKFLAVINPLETTGIVCTFRKLIFDEKAKCIKVSVVISSSTNIFTKLSLVYKKK